MSSITKVIVICYLGINCVSAETYDWGYEIIPRTGHDYHSRFILLPFPHRPFPVNSSIDSVEFFCQSPYSDPHSIDILIMHLDPSLSSPSSYTYIVENYTTLVFDTCSHWRVAKKVQGGLPFQSGDVLGLGFHKGSPINYDEVPCGGESVQYFLGYRRPPSIGSTFSFYHATRCQRHSVRVHFSYDGIIDESWTFDGAPSTIYETSLVVGTLAIFVAVGIGISRMQKRSYRNRNRENNASGNRYTTVVYQRREDRHAGTDLGSVIIMPLATSLSSTTTDMPSPTQNADFQIGIESSTTSPVGAPPSYESAVRDTNQSREQPHQQVAIQSTHQGSARIHDSTQPLNPTSTSPNCPITHKQTNEYFPS